MSTGAFARTYRRVISEALAPHGFERIHSHFYRVRDRLLHGVVLHKSNPWNFTGEFTVQPLVYADAGLILDFGDRVDEMVPGRDSWWELPEDRAGIEPVVRDYADSVLRYVVPWLDRFQTCRDVVNADLQKRWGVWRLDTPTKPKHAIILGLCALAADMPEEGKQYLEFARREYLRLFRPESSEWFRQDLMLVEEYLAMLSKGDWEGIRIRLAEAETFTRRSIGLPLA